MNTVRKIGGYVVSGMLVVGSAFAQSAPTVSDAQSALTTGVTTAGVLAGAGAALFGGLWVYRIVKRAGSKASS